MDKETKEWYLIGKNFLEISKYGIELLKKYLVNSEKLFQAEIYRHELPYVIVKELGDDINNISFMVFDEDKNDLYIVTDKQYKFSLQKNGLYLNEFMIDTSTIHIPEFEEESKVFIKK